MQIDSLDAITGPTTIPGRHTGIPGFFRACCREASRGGTLGYAHPAYELSRGLANQTPYDVDDEQWQEELDVLAGLLEADDRKGVWAWFQDHYPKCMTLIPARRRDQFVTGVFRAYEDETIDLGV